MFTNNNSYYESWHDRKTGSLNLIVLLSLSLIVFSCGDSSTNSSGGSGGNDGGGGNGGGNEIGTEPTFTNIQQIFEQSCGGGSCHISQATSGVQLNSYDNVMNSVGAQYGKLVIQPGEPDNSPLVDKIEPDPQINDRMPKNGNYLSDSRINQIREWIANGANNN